MGSRAIAVCTPLGVCLAMGFVAALLPAADPDLNRLAPTGGQRGAELDVLLTGKRLGDALQLVFYEPGLSVTALEPRPPDGVKVHLAIAADCRLGAHAVRVRTATGISDLHTFSVGALAEASEVEPNNDFLQPQKIALDTTVSGVVKNEDVDYFSVEAKKGERITAEIEGLRLGYTLFDPSLAILNTARFELARSDDSALLKQDAAAAIIAPEDGVYIIQVRESAYDGNDSSFYRLHVGRFPRPTAVFPAGGRLGETLEVRWLGDVAGERVETITLPASPPPDFTLWPRDERGAAPSGLPFRLVDFGNVLETEPNDTPETATPCATPIACNGLIATPGDIDHFKFHGAKGQQLDARVFARALGSPLDAVIDLYRVGAGHLAGNDDSGGPDSYLRFNLPEDGDYIVSIRDQLRQGGVDYVYRIEITPLAPSLALSLPSRVQYVDTTICVPQGNRMAALVAAKRADFGGGLMLDLKDLPAGVKVETFPMPANRSEVPVLFTAAEDAALATSLVDMTGRPADATAGAIVGGFTQKTELVRGPNNQDMWVHETRRMPLTVTQAAPLRVDIVEPNVPLVRGGAMNLKIVATRQAGFTAPIAVRMVYNPPGVGSSGVTIAEGQGEAQLPLTAAGDAELNKWPIVLLVEATVGDGPLLMSSQVATLEVAEPFVAFAPQAASVEQGKDVEMVIAVERKKDFEGPAKVELLGAPNEVTCEAREITRDSTQVVFQLKTTDKSAVGRHKSLLCRATIMASGEPIVHMLPAGELRIDAPLPPAATPAAAPTPPPMPLAAAPTLPAEKRLTRLEKLRLERQTGSRPAAPPPPAEQPKP